MLQFKLPAIGEGVVEGEIVQWLKKPGDVVRANEALVEIMTDKATVEIPAPQDCVVLELKAAEGAIAAVGETIALLDETATSAKPSAPPPGSTAPPPSSAVPASSRATVPGSTAAPRATTAAGILATPAARAHARENSIDLGSVAGNNGRITKRDVVRAQSEGSPSERETVVVGADPRPPTTAPAASSIAKPASTATGFAPGAVPDETIPFRGMRRRIAEGIHKSYSTAVHYTYVEQIDMSALVKLRAQAKKAAAEEGVNLSYLPFIVKAVLAGLRRYPIVNAVLDEEAGHIVLRKRYSIGVATATPQGLMVPVVHDADRRSILDIAREIARLSEAARDGKATRDELTGSTFTITSLGAIGGVLATPIINYPEVGILGVHAIRKTPVVGENDEIVVGHLMNLSVSLDHRVVDGFEGASFLQEVRRYLEDPTLLLLSGI
ncbi:MAG: 2-oxo acid dehydrogenase subunit E2 [Nannocystaceae bacterium]|nr:2-oxo acid dehydrogenase subunit E2 [Nannocystaceae bacterium]